ncbi:MAG: hypothetical protein ACI9W2_004331 [Gammaproteobacteria bacterium]|jgi:hypothetical protein
MSAQCPRNMALSFAIVTQHSLSGHSMPTQRGKNRRDTRGKDWARSAGTDKSAFEPGATGSLVWMSKKGSETAPERAELAQLRRENPQLRMEREISKKATAFFAKESM